MIGGKSDQVAGILFGLSPQGEYYAARYNTKEGNLAIWDLPTANAGWWRVAT